MIAISVNGKDRELEGETALPKLLQDLSLDRRLVAVAINGEVIPKNQYDRELVRAGDVIEIVRMVGGGSGSGRRGPGGEQHRSRPSESGRIAAHRSPRTSRIHEARPATLGADVVIVGAGIIGCAIAYELSRQGVPCVVLDSRRIGMASTNAAAGVLSPLAEFQRPDTLVRFGLESLRLYPEWVQRLREEVPDIDVEFTLNGVLRVAFEESELAELRKGRRYCDELGVELVELDGQTIREAEPTLSPKTIGGILSPGEGQVSNQLFTLALSRAATKRGARIIEDAPVERFSTRGGHVEAVRSPQGVFPCDHAVLASGAWTRSIAAKLGADVPVRPIRGQMLAFGRMVTPVHSGVWGPRGYLTPRANGLVFAGATVEDVGFRFRTTKRGLDQVRRGAFELVPQLRHAREHFSWFGLRPGSPDGLPMLGPLPGWDNVTVATGHFRNGILLAPITGELIARAIVGGRPVEALAPFDPGRFASAH